MDQPNLTFAKILILDTGKFEQWKFRIQQYLQNEHYALKEVIEFGDSYKAPPEETGKGPASESSAKKKGRTVVITTEDMQKRRNNVKARTTLLLALPDEHQLRFSKYETAKELWEVILKTFGGNEATKKTKKNQLKQQYGNFKAEGSKTLEQTFNRLQAIVSHLKFMDVKIKQDDLNQKFLTSLAPEWLIGKCEVYTASVPTASTQVSTASTDIAAASLSHDTVCAYIATQSNGSHIKYEDITQIDEDDIEEMYIKWNTALLSMRADRFWKKTGKKITIQGSNVEGFDKSKVECFNCHKMGHFAREYIAPKSQDRGKRESYKQGPKEEEPAPKALMAIDDIGWDWSYMANEEENDALVADDEVLTEFSLMTKSSSSSKNEVKKEKESLDYKLTGFENASKDLDNLLGSQRSDKNKEGLGYNAVPPPLLHKSIYLLRKICLGQVYLNLLMIKFIDDTITDYSRPIPSIDATKCNKSKLQSSNFPAFEHGESSDSIMSKPMIKFVKEADYPRVIKSNKTKKARKSPVKYAEMYRNISKGKTWPKDNYAHKRMTPRAVLLKPVTTPIVETREKLLRPQLVGFGDLNKTLLKKGNLQNNIDDKGYCDSGCSQHMTGNISYLSEYEPYDGGYVLFGHGGGKITSKGIIKTDFKLKDDTNVLLRTPRQHNMYSIDLNNIVPHKNLTCLVTKASVDERKQHKASCKSKLVNSVSKPLHTLHIDLFVPTSVSSLNHKWYCLVVTDDFCRCDNRGEFKNKEMNELCTKKGIRREPNNARTPQQNRVAERRNRTLIKAARTITPAIGFLRPFGCHVMILNTLDHLGKFDAKGDEVVVARTSSTNILGTKDVASQDVKKDVSFFRYIALPNWFHEAHMKTRNSDAVDGCNADVPESSGISNPTATSKVPSADQVVPDVSLTVESKISTVNSLVPTAYLNISLKSLSGPRLITKGDFSQKETPSLGNALTLSNKFEDTFGMEADLSNMETSIPVSPTLTFRIHKDHPKSQIIVPIDTPVQTRHKSKEMEERNFIAIIHQKTNPDLLQFCLFSCFLSQEEPKKIFNSLKDPSWEEGINYKEVFAPVARIEAIRLFLAYALFIGFIVYQMDVKSAFLYGTIDEELCREFEALMHDNFQMSAMGELTFFRGLQVLQKKDGIFLSQDKYVGDILKKFGYSDVRSANTPMDKENPWGKDRPDSDYGGATQERKSTTGEYVAAASRCGQVLWIQNQMLDYGVKAQQTQLSPITHTYLRNNIYLNMILHLHHIQLQLLNQFLKLPLKLSPLGDILEGIYRLLSLKPFHLLQMSLHLFQEIIDKERLSLLSLDAGQDGENIAKTSTLPHESSPRVTSLDADEGSIQQRIHELMELCTSLQRQQSYMVAKIKDQDLEISGLKARGDTRDREELGADKSTELGSNDTEEMVNVLTLMDAANILTSGGAAASVSPGDVLPTVSVPTVSGSFPTVGVIFTTAKEKGKKKVVESKVPKKRKLQEQIDAQVAIEMKEEHARENQRLSEQLARDSEIARLHAEEELKIMIEGLDRNNEMIAKHLREYEQATADLSVGEKLELISKLVKYQDHRAKILKYQAQQSKPLSKKEQRGFYMSVSKAMLDGRLNTSEE
nr:hypothetical protein [Tanacetum cinerariifolium]